MIVGIVSFEMLLIAISTIIEYESIPLRFMTLLHNEENYCTNYQI